MFAKRITLGIGRTIVLDLPADASEIVVGDPKVANAVVRSTRKMYVMGLATGQTTILAMDHAGRQIANIEMNVGRDLDELDKLLRAALPKTSIVSKQVSDSIVLTGEAQSSGEAATAIDIAKAYVSRVSAAGGAGAAGDGAVVNAITIRSQEQVMVKLTIAEVQRTILKQLGVSTSSTGDTILKTAWATLTQQNAYGLNGQMSNSGLTIPLGSSLTATMTAFERYGVSRILAEPTVTAVSGEIARNSRSAANCRCRPAPLARRRSASPPARTRCTFKPYGMTLNMTPVVIGEGRILLRLATEVTEIDTTQTITIDSISVPGSARASTKPRSSCPPAARSRRQG